MNIKSTQITKLTLTNLDRLDPVSVFIEDITEGKGQITIICYGKAWTFYAGSIGSLTMAQFVNSCDEDYLVGKMSDIEPTIYDVDAIKEQAEDTGVECHRDDPWNDYAFLAEMYGYDMTEWEESLLRKPNPKYVYLCRIINAVKTGLIENG